MSVIAMGLPLYVEALITPNDFGIDVVFPGWKACQISTFAPLLAE
jgi:hypothetical protein